AQAVDVLIDASVTGRLLTGRTGGDPPADGAEFEGLRVMAEREAARLQTLLEFGSEDPGLNGRRQRLLVDVEDPVETSHADAHDRGEPAAHGIDAADDAGAAADGNDRDGLLGAHGQEGVHL